MTNEAKHSKGPWSIGTGRVRIYQRRIQDVNGTVLGYVFVGNETADANAALIASAPELAADVERLTAQRDALVKALDDYKCQHGMGLTCFELGEKYPDWAEPDEEWCPVCRIKYALAAKDGGE